MIGIYAVCHHVSGLALAVDLSQCRRLEGNIIQSLIRDLFMLNAPINTVFRFLV